MPKISAPTAERLEDNSIPEPNSGCTLWFGPTDRCGYGQLMVHGRARRATHLSLEQDGRAVPRGMCACHKCDTPACINPDHLFVGTQADNLADMRAKGRHNYSGLGGHGSGASGSLMQAHCRNGHELTSETLVYRKPQAGRTAPHRECRICGYERRRAWRARSRRQETQ